MRRRLGLFLLVGIAGCGGKKGDDGVDEKSTMGLAAALAAVGGAEPTRSASLLAEGAFETVAPSMMCLKGFAAAAPGRARMEALFDCGLACTSEAVQTLKGTEPRTWMSRLAASCKPEHFGLEAGQAALISPEWFVLHKVGEIVARHATGSTGAAKAKLDETLASFRMPLPLPAAAADLYELPVVPTAASVPIATRTYVIASVGGTLWVGATPHARLGAGGASVATADGRKAFPGNEVDRADLRAAVLEAAGAEEQKVSPPPDAAPPAPPDAGSAPAQGQYKMKNNFKDPALAREQAMEAARQAGILKTLEKVEGGAFASMTGGSFGGIIAGLRGRVEPTLLGDATQAEAPLPLLVADKTRPAAEVIELAVELKDVIAAVASADDPGARALPIELAGVETGDGFGPSGGIRVTVGADGARVETYPIGNADPALVARVDGAVPDKALAEAMAEARKKLPGEPVDEVVIKVEASVPWSEAMSVVAIVIANGGKEIVLTTEKLDQARAGGFGTGQLGHGASGQGAPAKTTLALGELKTMGGDSSYAPVIQRVVRSRAGMVRACYERALEKDAELAGKVVVKFKIALDGSVTGASGSGMPSAVTDCVARVVAGLKFPPPSTATTVSYPFVFKPSAPAP